MIEPLLPPRVLGEGEALFYLATAPKRTNSFGVELYAAFVKGP